MTELDQLRSFAQGVMESWPECGPDDGMLQDLAVKHGLLRPEERTQPCTEDPDDCWCAEYNGLHPNGAFADGPVTCYRKTRLLTGGHR